MRPCTRHWPAWACPPNATVLEPGCGIGNFMSHAPAGHRFIGVELDSISGRIAHALHPDADIRIESFRDTKLPDGSIDAVIGNPPFADVRLDYRGMKLPLHDFFFAKSLDALKPGGILALVTSHFTLDKQNAATREYLADRADFLGAIRLPSDAFKREGTAVVTDIVFLRKRAPGEPAQHADPEWLETQPLAIDGADMPINRYFLNHPEMVLGTWSRKDRLYDAGYSVLATATWPSSSGSAVARLPEFAPGDAVAKPKGRNPPPPSRPRPRSATSPKAASSSATTKSSTRSKAAGRAGRLWRHGCKANGTMTGKRLAALIGLRDLARRVLQIQNEGWPEANRNDARRDLNRAYDRFVAAYGPINKTTFTRDQ